MQDNAVIKTYVWHDGKCYFVSTIERDSSAAIIPAPRFNETIVWEYDWKTATRGKMIHQEDAVKGCIGVHQEIVRIIFNYGPEAIPESITSRMGHL